MKKQINKKQAIPRFILAFIILTTGIILNYLEIGNEFLGFQSVGNWLIFVGFIMFVIITLNIISNKKRIIDERMESIAYKASRITFISIILSAFTIMVIDAIKPITIPYSLFMSHSIAWIVLIYFISYKILERYF